MWTIEYKGWFIHGYCDRDECRSQNPTTNDTKEHKSLHAAKCYIGSHTTCY